MSSLTSITPATADRPRNRVLLEARGLAAGYGQLSVIRGVDVAVREREIAVLLGANGAGKTTTLRTLCGLLRPLEGEVLWRGKQTRSPLHVRARDGLSLVTEERSMFSGLTLRENMRVAGVEAEFVLDLFPELKPRLKVHAGLISGGEQQMLALGLALGRRPEVLLADELSLGLAPLVVTRLLDTLQAAAAKGLGILLVEQHVRQALGYADQVWVLNGGEMALSGSGQEMTERIDEIDQLYL